MTRKYMINLVISGQKLILSAGLGLGILMAATPPFIAAPALADVPTIVEAEARHRGDSTYDFTVTVLHATDGWDHWVDRWDILSPNGEVLDWRVILHPIKERPFTRRMRNVDLPPNTPHVYIRAHDVVHGLGPRYRVDLPR